MPSHIHQRVQSPSPPRQLYRQQFIQYQEADPPYNRQQQQQQNTWVGAIDDVYDGTFPSGPPPVFTTELPSHQGYPQVHYKSMAERRRAESERARRHHSPVEGASERGYLFGGMDFIDHACSPNHLSSSNPNDYEYEGEGHRSRRDAAIGPPRGPNDFYGLDYNTMASPQHQHIDQQEDIHYKGYVANSHENTGFTQPTPMLQSTTSRLSLNTKLFILSPSRQNPFVFHYLQRRSSRSQSAMVVQQGRGGGPLSAEDSSWYTTGNKEIMRHEPNWSRNVPQRRNAWETQSRSVDSRMQLPPWAKVPPQQPPYWAGRAQTTHNVWQSAADKGYLASSNYNTGYSNNGSGNAAAVANPIQGQQQQGRHVQVTEQSQPIQNIYANQSKQYHQKQVYYHEQPEEQHLVEYNTVHNTQHNSQQQYSQQQPLQQQQQKQSQYPQQTSKSSGGHSQLSQQPVPQRAPPAVQPNQHHQHQEYRHQQYYQQQQQDQRPEYVDRHHQQVLQQALQQTAAPHQHSNSSTTNLINQNQQPNQESNQKQSSTITQNATSYYAHQPTANYGGGGVAGVAPGPQINYGPASNKAAGSQQHMQQQQPHNLQQQQQHRQVYEQGLNDQYHSIQVQRNAMPIAAQQPQQPPQRNNYQRILLINKSTNKALPPDIHQDRDGREVDYSRELSTSTNPQQEMQLLKQEERRVVDEQLQGQPGIISRQVTTKFYKRKPSVNLRPIKPALCREPRE
uniref:Uncharacterized protein n=1 Tax=Ditylenchus dipsaci TaxID=166011 RepID=A0A915CVV8_9BILA